MSVMLLIILNCEHQAAPVPAAADGHQAAIVYMCSAVEHKGSASPAAGAAAAALVAAESAAKPPTGTHRNRYRRK